MLVLAVAAATLRVPVLGVLGEVMIFLAVVTVGLVVVLFLLRKLLWSVGRRLAFSYLLLGVLPIPLVLISLFVGGYLLSGFFAGHLYRQSAISLEEQLEAVALVALDSFSTATVSNALAAAPSDARPRTASADYEAPIALGYYEGLQKVGGAEMAPVTLPDFLLEEEAPVEDEASLAGLPRRSPHVISYDMPNFVALTDEQMTLAKIVRGPEDAGGSPRRSVLAFYPENIERRLRQRAGVWVELYSEGAADTRSTKLQIFGQSFYLLPFDRAAESDERYEFFEANDSSDGLRVIGFELAGPLRRLNNGEEISPSVSATLTATPVMIINSLFSRSPEIDTFGWLAFLLPSFLLFDIYLLAAFMAVLMIISISRAVNRLSKATGLVEQGDFSTRIPVRRKDQLGALQRDFNQMTSNLEHLVSEAARKEVLERDLDIAQEVQKSLLPTEVHQGDGYHFATYFEPSAGLAGDYFDIVEISPGGSSQRGSLAVVIADVAGHGLSAGLRMAMLKAGVITMVQDGREPDTIMASLDHLVRTTRQRHAFVTATLSLIDLDSGTMSVTNAGHVPCYLIRNGEVQEIFLQGTPLGVLGVSFGFEHFELESGDTVVWLSDGIVEANDGEGNQLGFDEVEQALAGPAKSPAEVRDRLLAAVRAHTGGGTPDDDCTLVVMRYE